MNEPLTPSGNGTLPAGQNSGLLPSNQDYNLPFANQNNDASSGGGSFPPFTRDHFSAGPDSDCDSNDDDDFGDEGFPREGGHICRVKLLDEVLKQLREAAEATEVQQQHQVSLTPKTDDPWPGDEGITTETEDDSVPYTPPSDTSSQPASAPQPTALPQQPATTPKPAAPFQPAATPKPASANHQKKQNKHHNSSADKSQRAALIAKLKQKAFQATFNGVTLDRNERLKIVAAVALCESGSSSFTSQNKDTEFSEMTQLQVSYARIVHIGLSYGVIQFTQDCGALGEVLKRMQKKNPSKFAEVFGDNWQQLITLTTTGLDVHGVNYLSGQAYWNTIKDTQRGKHLRDLARQKKIRPSDEIRGKRVQPIPVVKGGKPVDIWEGEWSKRFTAAGNIPDFQDAELQYAVEGYLNNTLPFCKRNNIRSGLGLTYVTACYVRGPGNMNIITHAAKAIGVSVPFVHTDDERKAVHYIGTRNKNGATIAGKKVQGLDIIRAKDLASDNSGLILPADGLAAEDHYSTATYTDAYDH